MSGYEAGMTMAAVNPNYGAKEARPSGTISERLEGLEKASCGLMENLERLRASLSPIMTPDLPRNGDKPIANIARPESPLASQIASIEYRMRDACDQIRAILDRIQL